MAGTVVYGCRRSVLGRAGGLVASALKGVDMKPTDDKLETVAHQIGATDIRALKKGPPQ